MKSEKPDTIKLDQFLKLAGCVQTGGHAKVLIQSGEVKVNDQVETRRGRKLVEGDRVSLGQQSYLVQLG
ncbi:MAG: RNA-binding S4 domain-containing protein [Oscillatoriales cyanobacterium RM2_1_1]|nr:RNA-binding S4 domain-containing protein [Oscillatoriales cyanobacterium RM2_1_1]